MASQPSSTAHIQLRERLQKLRSQVGKAAGGSGGSLASTHKRVDSGIARRLAQAKAPARNRKRLLLGGAVVLLALYLLVFVYVPQWYPEVDSAMIKQFGRATYSVQRLLRFVSLPVMYRLPKLSAWLHNPSCALNNPFYVSETAEDVAEGAEEFFTKKKKAGIKPKAADSAAAGGDESSEACSCIGIYGAGRVKNRLALKMKHLLKDPGMPMLLTVDNSLELVNTTQLVVALTAAMKQNGTAFQDNLCHAQPRVGAADDRGEKKCSNTVATVLEHVLANEGNTLPSLHFTWTYCRKDDTMAKLLRNALNPSSYLTSKGIIYTDSPSLIISKATNDTAKAKMPDALMVDLDIGVYHQLAGRRSIMLAPTDCKRCSTFEVQLSAGQVLFFHTAVWQENPRPAYTLDGDTNMWSITYGYSIGSRKTSLAPLYGTSQWQDDENEC